MGIEIIEFTPERVVATMPVAGNRQPFGLLHGGASAALAETMGSFHGSLVGGGKAPLGIELSCTHHRSATDGLVTAVSMPLHVGRTICTFEIVDQRRPGPADLHRAADRAAARPRRCATPICQLIMTIAARHADDTPINATATS